MVLKQYEVVDRNPHLGGIVYVMRNMAKATRNLKSPDTLHKIGRSNNKDRRLSEALNPRKNQTYRLKGYNTDPAYLCYECVVDVHDMKGAEA